jgi:hypothetical protein
MYETGMQLEQDGRVLSADYNSYYESIGGIVWCMQPLLVDYIVAPETMYRAQAVGGVQQGDWEIAGSSHRVLWARLPLAKEVAPPKPRPRPDMKWRVERLTDKQTGPKVIEAYQKSVKKTLARVKPQLSMNCVKSR